MATRDERAKARYGKKEAPAPKKEDSSGPDVKAGGDVEKQAVAAAPDYSSDRKAMLDRHLMELRDMRRQHAGEHRSILSRHDKESTEMMGRHNTPAADEDEE